MSIITSLAVLILPQMSCLHLVFPLLALYIEATLSTMATKIKEQLLTMHKESSIFTQNEVDALTALKASKSWLGKFAQKSGWHSIALYGEAGLVDIEAVRPQIVQLQELIKMYHNDHDYNMDETGLFFKVATKSQLREEE
jgi:hypothetical protein